MGPAQHSTPIAHERPAEGEAQELLALQRVMFWMRLIGLVLFLSQLPLYPEANAAVIGLAAVIVIGALLAQGRILRPGMPADELRRRSLFLLAADLTAVYVVATGYVPDAQWVGFYFYPLLAVEAAIVGGLVATVVTTAISTLVYLAQVVLHASLGNPVEIPEVVAGFALVAFVGGFMGVFGLMAERGRRDMRVLLDLTSALAHQQDEAETIELLDRRLQDAVGARVRSVAIRNEDGRFEIIRWHSSERRMLDRGAIETAIGDPAQLSATFSAGTALTWNTDAWSVITQSLGLPDWTRSVTMVPIFVEGQWIGVLPVLWPTQTVPNGRQLRLMYGLASQMGLALSQGQLQRVREEAATDPLTKLMNRRAILDELAAYVARAERAGSLMSVLFCDLDGFKAVNDTRGHDAGDEVLRAVATAMRRALRHGDVVGRYGGDEMLVVAADAGAKEASTLARRVREAVREAAGEHGVDVTIGIAVYPLDGHVPADLLGAADRAMYRGKVQGMGSVVLAAADDPEDDQVVGARA